jgi:hypothetical protein
MFVEKVINFFIQIRLKTDPLIKLLKNITLFLTPERGARLIFFTLKSKGDFKINLVFSAFNLLLWTY